MPSDPNQEGKALLIPSFPLRAGRFCGERRWHTEEDLYPESPATMAKVQRHYRNQRIHVHLDQGWSAADRAAIETLCAYEMVVIVEGLADRRALTEAMEAGATLFVLEPAFAAEGLSFVRELEAGVFVVVESPRTSSTIVEDMTIVRDGDFDGVVTAETTREGVDIAQMLGLIMKLDWPNKPLILARPKIETARQGFELIETMAPLGVTKLLDGEFLMNMIRFGRSEVVVERIGGDPQD